MSALTIQIGYIWLSFELNFMKKTRSDRCQRHTLLHFRSNFYITYTDTCVVDEGRHNADLCPALYLSKGGLAKHHYVTTTLRLIAKA